MIFVCNSYTNRLSLISLIFILSLFVLPEKIYSQSNDDCLMCHSDNTLTMEKNGRKISLYVDQKVFQKSVHGELDCVSCHVGFNLNNIPHKKNIQPVNCLMCHQDAPVQHPFHPRMLKANGIDGTPDVNCRGCHGTHDITSPETPGTKFSKSNIVNACGSCHNDEKTKYETSAHANGLREGVKGVPECLTCHKNPIVLTSAVKDTTKLKIAQNDLCLSCHLDNTEIRARTSPSAGFIPSYTKSVHGKALLAGNGKAANCVNCHTAHREKPESDPTSTINRFNIPNTCGKCHGKIEKEYKESIHGVAVLQKESIDAPVCTSCHGEHNILNPSNPMAPTSNANVSQKVCSRCHASVKLADEYGLTPNRLSTFEESYHGLSMQGGVTTVANCGSCHGVHLILAPNDPRSSVYKGNLAKTCGKCHPGANERFAIGKIHVSFPEPKETALHWIVFAYIILISLTIGAMFIHNVLDFIKKAKLKNSGQERILREKTQRHSLFLRMNMNERVQHMVLAISFITLAVTGFMLQFPDAWWVVLIRDIISDAFELRSIIHRVAGTLLIGSGLYHIYYITATRRGKQLIKDLLPHKRDFTDALGVAKYNLGLSKGKPKLDRFSYVEKVEYWALIWGTVIMSVTGIIMWFNNVFIDLVTVLGWDIARTIHFYEALLATLAIIVWHFYFVIFNPDVYPMNLAWLKGTLTEEEMEAEHPLELERIENEKPEEQNKNQQDL
jgi:cytochrome b subunit of formate dehydrogenase